jgi:hypothetical protein
MNEIWPWVVLAGLGVFHGLNPAMGWLFAVARGLQRGSRLAVLDSMLPIATGHALSIAIVVVAVGILRALVDFATLRVGAAALLIGFGIYRLVARHRARAGMQIGAVQLLLWSFLMATAHGAGLMLVPALLALPICAPHVGVTHMLQSDPHMQMMPADAMFTSTATAFAAVGIHTLAMLGVATVIAIAVYEWVGLAFLRRGWFNLDLLWAFALIGVGAILLATTYG